MNNPWTLLDRCIAKHGSITAFFQKALCQYFADDCENGCGNIHCHECPFESDNIGKFKEGLRKLFGPGPKSGDFVSVKTNNNTRLLGIANKFVTVKHLQRRKVTVEHENREYEVWIDELEDL